MPNRSTTGENNRANEGNQSSRHHHTRGKVADKDLSSGKGAEAQNEADAHEYYPEFDTTGKGVNPSKPVKRHSTKE